MSRYHPSKDKENITGRRSQVRDLDSGEKFKTSTLGEIVSLEKSNKNVIGLRILTSIQSKIIPPWSFNKRQYVSLSKLDAANIYIFGRGHMAPECFLDNGCLTTKACLKFWHRCFGNYKWIQTVQVHSTNQQVLGRLFIQILCRVDGVNFVENC
nr:hypothetical protein [Tanacetum cinerariifolium]